MPHPSHPIPFHPISVTAPALLLLTCFLTRSSPACALRALQSAVSSLRYHAGGALLASGGRDTDVIVWDVVGETGLYRLRGHKDQVTDLVSVAFNRKGVSGGGEVG